MISVHFQGKQFNITGTQVYAPKSNVEEAEFQQFHEDLQDLLELQPQDVLFIIGDWMQKWELKKYLKWLANWALEIRKKQDKGQRVLPRECTGHGKHPLLTIQENTVCMDITRWSIPKSDWLYSLQPKMEKLYTASKINTVSWLWLRSWTLYWHIQTYIEENRENH